MTHLLDTDHLSVLQYPNSREYPVLVGHMSRHPAGSVAASVVNIHEQTRGAHNLIARASTSAELVRGYEVMSRIWGALSSLPVLAFDAPAAVTLDLLKGQRIRIGTMDLRIAAVALANRLVVVTRNSRDFGQVPGLRVEDWTR